jgi:hypothetical protein
VILRVHYEELEKELSNEKIAEIREAGVVIIRGAVSKEVHHRIFASGGIHTVV